MRKNPPAGRPLLNAWSALGLTAAASVAFAAVFPMSRDRQARALEAAPDMLALSYLDLALSRAPEDATLRLSVAERTLAAGQFDRARALLVPLLGEPPLPAALLLRVEIDYLAWAATDADDDKLRTIALARLGQSIDASQRVMLSTEQAEHVARICGQVGLAATRAGILERVARANLRDDERLLAAEVAQLEINAPLTAAELRAARALTYPEDDGSGNAALALRRALASGQPGPALVMFRRLRPLYGQNPQVLELGLATLAGVDDVEALSVAEQLLTMKPDDAALRQRIAELNAWTRSSPPAPAPAAPVSARPPELRWDTESLLVAEPVASSGSEDGARAIERAALLDSLGAPERAIELIDRALAQELVDERALWDLKVGVLLRLGQKQAALDTLEHMDDRFGPSQASIQRRAELLLSLGELARALDLLAVAPGPRRVEDERRITAISWELGDIDRVRTAYRVIARSPEGTPEDARRLWLLERESGDHAASTGAALAAFERFADPAFVKLALHTAIESGDDGLVATALGAARASGADIDPESLSLSVNVRHARAHRALLRNEHEQAKSELGESARLLERVQQGSDFGGGFGELVETQKRQTLNLALAADDRKLLARTYPEQEKELTARERVFVLHRLGRDEEAVSEAVASIDSGALPEADSGALAADAQALGGEMPRQLGVLGDVVAMQGLTAARAGALGRLSWSGGRSLGARVELTRLSSSSGGDLTLPSPSLSGLDELAAELSGGIGESELTVGVVALEGDARPSLRFEQGFEGDALTVELLARLNERSRDTPVLRVIGVEDELSARATIQFLQSYSASVRGSTKLYSDRVDRQVLGGAATLDASVGRSWHLPEEWSANLRAAGYVAPRFESDLAGPVPEGASWVGVGASLLHGQLSVAPVAGRRVSVLVDGTAGWLLPLDELGWSGTLGLGISVLGGDQLSILASASNVVGTTPGFAVYTLGADYAVSRW
jgi:hypothetical protein